MNRRQLYSILSLLLILGAGLLARHILTDGLPVFKLSPAPALTGIVSQSLGPENSNSPLPVPGKEFNLTDVTYFENGTWAIGKVQPLQKNTDTAYVVFKKIDGGYQVVLGPGTAFSSEFLQSMPASAGQYLFTHGVVYEPQ